MEFNKDVFSSGQVSSKLWLCRKLEETEWKSDITWIYGGWHGMLAFLLLSRENFSVNKIRSFDVDSQCEPMADIINENWIWQEWKFKAFTEDCNSLIPYDTDLVINTSTEHFLSNQWWDNIPPGHRVVLQGNNLEHKGEQTRISKTLDEFVENFPLSDTIYSGKLDFVYPNNSFSRFMVIGTK